MGPWGGVGGGFGGASGGVGQESSSVFSVLIELLSWC